MISVVGIQKYESSFLNLKIGIQISGLKIWGRDLEKIQRKNQNFQNSKNGQNHSQNCPNVFCGNFFEKKVSPSVPWRIESSKNFKKIKNFSKFQKCSKLFPKVSKRVLNMFRGTFFGKKICSVLHGVSSLQLFLNWMPNNADSICRKVCKKLKLRRPCVNAIILLCWRKSAMMALPNTLTDSYTRFLPEAQLYLNSITRTPKSKPYITTLPKKNLF